MSKDKPKQTKESNKKDDRTEIAELNANIEKLNKGFDEYFSLKKNFIKSIVSGVGGAIGATIVAGLLIAILSATIDSIEDVPIIDDLIRNSNIKEILDTDK